MNSLAAVPPLILKQSDCHNQGLPAGSDSKECGRPRFDPWVKKIPWRREKIPTSILAWRIPMDCIVHEVTKSQTRLSFSFTL